MAVIFPDYPDHGEGDWDVPLLSVLDTLVNAVNSHDVKISLLAGDSTLPSISVVQNPDGTWTMSISGNPPTNGGGVAAGYDGGTTY